MESTFYSRGKLLLTGEYVVLDGAKALALPTKKGQSLVVTQNDSCVLNWTSYDCHNKIWYKTTIDILLFFNDSPPKGNSKFDETLFKILWVALKMNPFFLKKNVGYQISTHLEFERLWGLGTSSTLINNIAQWASINPFELLNKSFGGSGYDIAAATANTPIFYNRNSDINNPTIEKALDFNPKFKNRLFFIYLEEKKDSKEAIKNYRDQPKKSLSSSIEKINQLTKQISICSDFSKFEDLLRIHEKTISNLINSTTIQEDRFSNFPGVVKSLGGWGGDFILVTGSYQQMNYFKNKNYTTIINFSDLIL